MNDCAMNHATLAHLKSFYLYILISEGNLCILILQLRKWCIICARLVDGMGSSRVYSIHE